MVPPGNCNNKNFRFFLHRNIVTGNFRQLSGAVIFLAGKALFSGPIAMIVIGVSFLFVPKNSQLIHGRLNCVEWWFRRQVITTIINEFDSMGNELATGGIIAQSGLFDKGAGSLQ